jgi:hypothetical protein
MTCNRGEGRRSFFFDEREKLWEAGDEFSRVLVRSSVRRRSVRGEAFEALVKAFLKFCYVDVEA